MMNDCPLAIRHKKGEYIWVGDFVDIGRFLCFGAVANLIVSRCFIMYLYSLANDVFCFILSCL